MFTVGEPEPIDVGRALQPGTNYLSETGSSPDGAVTRGVVLVVEDSSVLQDLMASMLTHLGIRHRSVSDGAAAVEFVNANDCMLVLMDLRLPVMDGEAAALAIRQLPGKAGQVPIVCLSGGVVDEDRERLRASGFVDTITKPLRLSELARVIRAHSHVTA